MIRQSVAEDISEALRLTGFTVEVRTGELPTDSVIIHAHASKTPTRGEELAAVIIVRPALSSYDLPEVVVMPPIPYRYGVARDAAFEQARLAGYRTRETH